MRTPFYIISALALAAVVAAGLFWPPALLLLAILIPLIGVGLYDVTQKKHAVRRNFPVIGHMRYILEKIRPEINQYFIESNSDGRPFSREDRSVVYQRAKGELDTLPFGTQRDVYAPGYEWINHSLAPSTPTTRARESASAARAAPRPTRPRSSTCRP